jgi:uncharacterized protein RhaS with RHS repeats
VNAVNQYTQINGPGTSTDIVSYDKNGNVIQTIRQALAYQYDYRNRLRKVCRLSGTATSCTSAGALVVAVYNYDAQNRRTRKVVTNSGALNGTTNFYYDGWQTIEDRDGAGSLQRQYVFGRDLDEPIVLDRAGAQYDAYGSPTVFASGFVNVIVTASALGNPSLYTGQRLDAETGLYYYATRLTDPLG